MAIPKQTLTTNGFEMQMGVNHFGHFHLTFLLWRLLCKSEEPRIICVSSRAHKRKGIMLGNVPIDFADINYRENYNPFTAYSRSKAANILFAK